MSNGEADDSTTAGPGGSALRGVAKIIAIIGVLGLGFVVSLKYAFSRLAIKVSNAPSLVINSEQIQGSFRLERDEVNGILSKGVGGACLIGDFAGQLTLAVVKEKGVVITTACTTREDCNPNFTKADDKAGPTHPQKWEGYCVPTDRSEEHTSELQSLRHLVCRLLLEKKKKLQKIAYKLRCTDLSSDGLARDSISSIRGVAA